MDLQAVLASHKQWLMKEDGQRADLSGANLSDVNLSGANLSGANLSGANLFRTNLSRANLSRANLSGANLSGVNLSDANLSGVNLFRANLSGADLSRAFLFRANLSRANLSGIKPSWQSHDLIATLLAQECETVEQWKVAGFILIQRNMCWSSFIKLKDPLTEWALSVLRNYETRDNQMPFEDVPDGEDHG